MRRRNLFTALLIVALATALGHAQRADHTQQQIGRLKKLTPTEIDLEIDDHGKPLMIVFTRAQNAKCAPAKIDAVVNISFVIDEKGLKIAEALTEDVNDSNAPAPPSKDKVDPAKVSQLSPGSPGNTSGLQFALNRKPRIAVLDFDYATVQSTSAALFGTNVDLGKGIGDLLVSDLVKDGRYSIVERKQVDKILAEQNFANSNRADPSSAAKIAKLLGVDAIIVGSITEFGNDTKKSGLGGAGGNWHGAGLGGVGHSTSKANVVINARIISVDSAEILGVADGKAQASRSSTNILGGGGNWSGAGAGSVNFGSSDFQQTIIGEATKAAVDQLSTNLVADAPKIATRTILVEGVVAAVEGNQIVLNIGAKAGIKVGDQFNVERVTKEIKDPTTGNVLRRLSSTVGVVKATDVDDVSAICEPVSGSGFKTGDRIKTVTQ